MKGVRYLFFFALLLAVLEALYFYPIMPSRIAIHFNAAGIADGWGPKQFFFGLMGAVFAFMVVLFGSMSLLIRKLPDSMINLPNKAYWLAPERRELTHRRISVQMLFPGSVTLLLLDGVLYMCGKANLSPVPAMQAELLWGLLILYFIVNIIFIFSIIRSYRQPAQDLKQKQ